MLPGLNAGSPGKLVVISSRSGIKASAPGLYTQGQGKRAREHMIYVTSATVSLYFLIHTYRKIASFTHYLKIVISGRTQGVSLLTALL